MFESFPLSERLLSELERQAPFLSRATVTAKNVPLIERLPLLERIASRLSGMYPADWMTDVVRAYVVFCHEVQRLQRQLEQTGRYLLSSEREAYERVYSQSDVLGAYYLPGLLLTQGLWPTHYALAKAFEDAFLPEIPVNARVLEIGVGTGFHLRALMEDGKAHDYTGVDISSFAIDFAKRYAFHDGETFDAAFVLQNATDRLPFEDNAFDAAICGEVLEHVEAPAALLGEIARVCRPTAPFFMTTAIFAADVSHIYLFENAAQVRELVRSSGWLIERDWVFPVYGTDPEDSRKPASIGTMLRRP